MITTISEPLPPTEVVSRFELLRPNFPMIANIHTKAEVRLIGSPNGKFWLLADAINFQPGWKGHPMYNSPDRVLTQIGSFLVGVSYEDLHDLSGIQWHATKSAMDFYRSIGASEMQVICFRKAGPGMNPDLPLENDYYLRCCALGMLMGARIEQITLSHENDPERNPYESRRNVAWSIPLYP